jgi:putative ABC transport system permease protein
MHAIFTAVTYAWENIRTHFFHTALSVLGIIIGVAALFSILSMIDGLEKFANDQINRTTSLKVVELTARKTRKLNGVQVPLEKPLRLTEAHLREILPLLPPVGTSFVLASSNRAIRIGDTETAAVIHFSTEGYARKHRLQAGDWLTETHSEQILINTALARQIKGDSLHWEHLIGTLVHLDSIALKISGIVDSPHDHAEILVSLHTQDAVGAGDLLPFLVVEAGAVEDVPAIKEKLAQWAASHGHSEETVSITSQDFRVKQATQGFALFRLIMGLIIGISVVVGGVGVMNVLLISVTQRTQEIGLRKAVGARKRDIYLQFLTEAVLVSVFGTLLGMVLGGIFTLLVSPLVHSVMELDFHPVFRLHTVGVLGVISLVIGVVFGMFPAVKASRLNPIEALRRE